MQRLLLRPIALMLFACSWGIESSFSQEYQYHNYNELNGLPSSETYQLIQDSQGFIWIATDNGVVRFDGSKFQHYTKQQGLPDNTIFGFHLDSDGRIWFRSYSGALSYYDDGVIQPYIYNKILLDTLRGGLINDIRIEKGKLWFAPLARLSAGFIDEQGMLTITEGPVEDCYIYALTFPNQQFMVGMRGRGSVVTVRAGTELYKLKSESSFRNSPVAVRAWWNNALYFAANKEIFRFKNGHLELVHTLDEQIISMYVDRKGDLWAGFFNGGVRRYTAGDLTHYTPIPQLDKHSVSSILQDHEGGYWFSTLDRGVFYFPNLHIRIIKSLDDPVKIAAVAQGKHAVYVGDYEGKVKMLGPLPEQSRIIFEDTDPVSALFEDENGALWGSHKIGFFVREQNGFVRREYNPAIMFKGFFNDSFGIMHGFYSFSSYSLEGKRSQVKTMNFRSRPMAVATQRGRTYVGTLLGLERFDEQLRPFRKDSLILQSRISSLLPLPPDQIAVGTIGEGLFVIRDEELMHLTNLPAYSVYSMVMIENRLWVATERGILISGRFTNDLVPDHWSHIGISSGLLSNKCNFIASLGKEVIVFSDQGISVLPQDISVASARTPTVYIKKAEVNNEVVEKMAGHLAADENNISLEVGAIAFNNRELFFRHRVNQSDTWNYSDGKISYFDLPHGDYHIEVEVSADNILWLNNGMTIVFTIAPPWWASWPFRSLAAVTFLILGYLVYRMRIKAIKGRQNYLELINSHQQRLIDAEIQTQERERKRIAKDLHDGVGTSLSSIKILVSDSGIASELERAERIQQVNENLSDVIIEIKRIVYDLHPPALERYGLQVGLKNLAEKINALGGISIIYDYYGQREVSVDVAITIYRIAQELINNTLKHAHASEIRIHVNQFEDEMNIMYEDNGIGMIGSRFNGLGLHSIESRVRSLQGRMTWESNHKGTFYNFDIPF